jgi:hypothetical protein
MAVIIPEMSFLFGSLNSAAKAMPFWGCLGENWKKKFIVTSGTISTPAFAEIISVLTWNSAQSAKNRNLNLPEKLMLKSPEYSSDKSNMGPVVPVTSVITIIPVEKEMKKSTEKKPKKGEGKRILTC